MRLASFVAFVVLVCNSPAAAPSLDEILARSRQALGNVAALKSLSITGVRRISVEADGGSRTISNEEELHFLLPARFLKSTAMELPNGLPGPTIVEALDGEASWRDTRNTPAGGNIVIRMGPPGGGPEGPDAEQTRTRLLRATYLRYWLIYTLTPPSGMPVSFTYGGEAESPDGKAWIIDAAGPDQFSLRVFIDQQSYLPLMATWRGSQAVRTMVRRVQGAGPAEVKAGVPSLPEMPKPREVAFQLRLSEYAKYGGVLLPKVMTLAADGKPAEEFEIKSAKINPNLKPEKFRK
jgi:hypothetical protein